MSRKRAQLKIEDLPHEQAEELTADQAEGVQGGEVNLIHEDIHAGTPNPTSPMDPLINTAGRNADRAR